MRTQDLIGAQLDWAVAKCEGYVLTSDGISNLLVRENETLLLGPGSSPLNYSPICYWMQGGEIIEREGINLSVDYQDDALSDDMVQIGWKANYWNDSVPGTSGFLVWAYGPTPLIAAMRVYVMAKFGREIEVPEELK